MYGTYTVLNSLTFLMHPPPHMTCMYPPPHMTCMYPPPHMTCMYPPPHMTYMYGTYTVLNSLTYTVLNSLTFLSEIVKSAQLWLAI